MIDFNIYRTIRNGVCGIGYLTQPLETYRQNTESAIFQVIGTGFLVDKTTVLTNRHVIFGLLDVLKTKIVPPTQIFIQFVVPGEDGNLLIVPRLIRQISYLDEINLDIGMIRYRIVHEDHFNAISPLYFIDQWDLKVSEEVGVCGYPYGTTLLAQETIYRWGPVVQQGHISAISPFDSTIIPNEILLDVRTAGGMSGAPIFRPSTGKVIGVHYAGIEATTAFGIPLTSSSVKNALQQFDKNGIDINEP